MLVLARVYFINEVQKKDESAVILKHTNAVINRV